ncbi:hypothetical protein CVT24_002499 [Panaeolus cyanescens]|uniref:Uncharacterized protein n=1 Tax=Panaeolus cyanescens TaxID=181874 RepID=A0A409WBN7_9AGAR|nr:hypothetical protein CVT24_002499 [Panaeolus cyanescens]
MDISPSRDEIIYKLLRRLQNNFAALERLDNNLSLHKKISNYVVSRRAELHDDCIGIFKALELHLQAVRGSSQEESRPIPNGGIDAAYCSETKRILHSLPEVVGHLFNTTIHLNNVGNTFDSTFRSQSNVDVGDTYTSRRHR